RETWSQFMRAQASSIIACDLFTVESIRLRTLHVLFFIDLHTRQVLLGGVTAGPANVTWCAQIARNLTDAREARTHPIRFHVDHYNTQRPHRGRDLHPPNGPPPVVPLSSAEGVARRDRLGGLLHEYYRKAA